LPKGSEPLKQGFHHLPKALFAIIANNPAELPSILHKNECWCGYRGSQIAQMGRARASDIEHGQRCCRALNGFVVISPDLTLPFEAMVTAISVKHDEFSGVCRRSREGCRRNQQSETQEQCAHLNHPIVSLLNRAYHELVRKSYGSPIFLALQRAFAPTILLVSAALSAICTN